MSPLTGRIIATAAPVKTPKVEARRSSSAASMLHVLPDGFRRIRHFGFLANGHRTQKLALCRSLLSNEGEPTAHGKEAEPPASNPDESIGVNPPLCPECGGACIEDHRRPASRRGMAFGPRRPRFLGATLHEPAMTIPPTITLRAHSLGADNRTRSKRLAASRRHGAHNKPDRARSWREQA